MTEKQQSILYYRTKGYTARQCSLIAGTSDNYARKVIGKADEVDLEKFYPPAECQIRRRLLDHILSGAEYAFVPRSDRYAYVSLLAYIGVDYKRIRELFPEDEVSFLYMAVYRSGKAWKDFNPQYLGISEQDYCDLLQIRKSHKK